MVKNKNSNLIAQGTVEEFFGKPSKPIVYGSMKADASIGKFSKKSTAQGTVEYLVILAVVVVISLVVVGIFTNMFSSSSQQVVNSSSKLGTSSGGGISIVESVLDVEGDSLVKVSNASTDPIVLTKISMGGVDRVYSEQVVGRDSKTFSLSDLTSGCTCAANQKSVSCEYVISYTQNGISKTDRFTKSVECVVDSVPGTSQPVASLGSGSSLHPWIINSCQELQDMNLRLDGNYALGKDIDCSDTRNWNNGLGFSPIGNVTSPFKGNFEGRNFTISNLYINRPSEDNLGLFGVVVGNTTRTQITNLKIYDFNIIGRSGLGGVAGYIEKSYIENVQVRGTIYGWNVIGGITGNLTDSNLYKSSATCTLTGTGYSTYNVVGGLAGWFTPGSNINQCFADVDMTMRDASNGGLVAWFSSDVNMIIINSYAKGIIRTPTGISGDYTGGISGPTSINNAIYNSYSVVTLGSSASGCLYGYNYGKSPAVNSFYDNTICATHWSGDGSLGRSTALMKTQSTFTNAGWDFTNIWEIDPVVNNGYPHLRWENN